LTINLHFSDKLSSPFLVKPDKNYKDKAMKEREGEEGVEWKDGETRRQGENN